MVSKIHQVHLLSEAEGNFVVACPMFVIGPFVWSYFCDKIVRILSSPPLFSLRKKRLIILHRVFLIFCVWSLCLDICGRTVKLSFLSCGFNGGAPNNGGKYTLLGSCAGGSDVCYDVTLCFLSRALEIVCFLLVLCWITIVGLWK